ncbi:MAG: SelD-related putative sulfur metabolism protein [Acidilobus sp.]|nr:SelD-related putative sulfur metabolism protein [Acidilobus sp.]
MVRPEVSARLAEVRRRSAFYRSLGADPMSLAAGCAVKVDLVRVVYPAMEELRRELSPLGLEIAEREDADVAPGDPSEIELERLILPLGREADLRAKGLGRARAAVLIQVYQMNAGEPKKFASMISPAYRSLLRVARPLRVAKGHSIITPFREDEFLLADLLPEGKGDYLVAINNDTMHVIDPTGDLLDPRQVSGALLNSMNDLFVIGVHRGLAVAPVINARDESVKEGLLKNAASFASSVGARLLDVEMPKEGRLLMGGTVIGYTDRSPPQFKDKVEVGMKLIATRPFGELAPITTYLVSALDESVVDELEAEGLSFEALERAKEEAVRLISTPNKAAAEVIERHLPELGEPFDPTEHIPLTTDVTGQGAYSVRELADLAKVEITLYDFPLLFPEVSEFAARHFIMPNATSGTNGGFLILAPDGVADDIIKELRSRGYSPSVIGEVTGKGRPAVKATPRLANYIFDEALLSALGLRDGGL